MKPADSLASDSSPVERDGGSTDLASLIAVLSESRALIAGIAVAVLILGTLYSFVRAPVYEANTVLQVLTQQSGGLSGLEALSALVQGSAVPTETEIQLLQTRAVVVPVIRKLHLNIRVARSGWAVLGTLFGRRRMPPARLSVFEVPRALEGRAFEVESSGGGEYRLLDPDGTPVLTGRVGEAALGHVMTHGGPGLVSLRIDAITAGTRTFDLTRLPTDQVVLALLARLSIRELGKQSGVINVSMRGSSADGVAAELSALAATNVELNIRQKSSQAAGELGFLKAQLPKVESDVRGAQARLAAFLAAHPTTITLSQDAQYVVQQAWAVDKLIGPLQAQLAVARRALGPQSPRLIALDTQMRALVKQRQSLWESIGKLPRDEQTLVRLRSDATTEQTLYASMLDEIQTLQIAEAGTIGDVIVVDRAVAPSRPTAPKKGLDAAISLVLGAILGMAAAFARRALRHGIEDPEVLDERLGLPVYAVIAHSSAQRRLERRRDRTPALDSTNGILAAQSDPDDQTAEGLRSLRTAIQLALPGGGKHIICMTSLSPSEGKSFISTNLAYLFARSGTRVLLVDGDLRRGHVHRTFGRPRTRGFADVLRGDASLHEVAHPTHLDTLHVMTTGDLPDDAASLLVNGDVGAAFSEFTRYYDLVIIDVPPVLAVSDAFILARHATLCLLILKHGLHSVRQIRLALKRLVRHEINVKGCVLNDVSAAAQRYAYREYGYQYQYRYK